MSDAGNVLDAVGLAVKAALADAVVPKVEVIEGETPEDTTIEVTFFFRCELQLLLCAFYRSTMILLSVPAFQMKTPQCA